MDVSDLTAGLLALASRCRVPLRTVFLATHLIGMRAVTGGDAYTAVIANGRLTATGPADETGSFLNPVPFGVATGAANWAELVAAVHAAEAEMLPYRRLPWAAMRAPGSSGPLPLRTCFTHVDFGRLGLGDESAQFVEDVRTGVPLLINAEPGAVVVEGDPLWCGEPEVTDLADVHRAVLSLATAVSGAPLAAFDGVRRSRMAGRSTNPPASSPCWLTCGRTSWVPRRSEPARTSVTWVAPASTSCGSPRAWRRSSVWWCRCPC